MRSVRERLERAQNHEPELSSPQPGTSRSMSGVGYMTPSTRQTAELAADVSKEKLKPPTQRAPGVTSFHDNVQTSVRGRDEFRRAQQEAQAPPQEGSTSRRALIDYFADQYLEECAKREAEEAAKVKAEQERVAKEKAQQKAEAERALWMIGVNSALDTIRASDEEKAHVLGLPTVKVGDDPNKIAGIVLTLRGCHAKPSWASGLVKK